MRARLPLLALAALVVTLGGCGGEAAPGQAGYRSGSYADWKRDRDAWDAEHVAPLRRELDTWLDRQVKWQELEKAARELGDVARADQDAAEGAEIRTRSQALASRVAALKAERDRLISEPKEGL